jgi:hypothetical protein
MKFFFDAGLIIQYLKLLFVFREGEKYHLFFIVLILNTVHHYIIIV